MNARGIDIEPSGPGKWAIRVRRSSNGVPAIGSVVVRSDSRPDADNPPHAKLAGSRAWFALAETKAASKDWDRAIALARSGLQELGEDYARADVVDETALKLLVAEEQIGDGDLQNAASTMLRMLNTRLNLYADRHRDVIVE